ncbi:MAG: 2-oxo acid dehydrogenase subunit E2 [Rhodospirillales bacterium]|nr:MAG: 2-oxo acid dehydrogenase subunit E2 [Rhodospirillales bacterium]
MSVEFRLQDPGEGIHEAEIREILVSVGDTVEEGQEVLVVETDKASVELPSPASGTVEKVAVEPGQVVEVGDLLMTFAEEDRAAEPEPESKPEPEEPQPERAKPKEREPEDAEPEKPEPEETEPKRQPDAERRRPVPASPATRRVAKELGVDLRDVSPREGERVRTEDVRAHAGDAEKPDQAEPSPRAEPARERPEAPPLPDFAEWGPIERQPLRSLRRSTARHMAHAWTRIPHVTHHDLVDVTDLEHMRRRHEAAAETRGGKLTLTVFALKAAAAALSEFPRFNASFDQAEDALILKRYCHIGVALDSERGLIVPVIRDVDRKSAFDLAVELKELSDRVRGGEASKDDLQGGSFTVTNVGSLGGTAFTPIINWPQVAILGMARSRLQPVIRGDLDDYRVEARLMLPLSFAFDHRAGDGAEAARFVRRIAELLEDPEQFALAT